MSRKRETATEKRNDQTWELNPGPPEWECFRLTDPSLSSRDVPKGKLKDQMGNTDQELTRESSLGGHTVIRVHSIKFRRTV